MGGWLGTGCTTIVSSAERGEEAWGGAIGQHSGECQLGAQPLPHQPLPQEALASALALALQKASLPELKFWDGVLWRVRGYISGSPVVIRV